MRAESDHEARVTENGESWARLYSLDVARMVAAGAVVAYHYLCRGWIEGDRVGIDLEGLEWLAKYGYLGVPFFFILSGFVISITLERKTLGGFVYGRIRRLMPAFAVSVPITYSVMLAVDPKWYSVGMAELVLNWSFIGLAYPIEYVDGVYWTLHAELMFYLGIAIAYYGVRMSRRTFADLWLVGVVAWMLLDLGRWGGYLAFLGALNSAPYFVIGIYLYEEMANKNSRTIMWGVRWSAVFITVLVLMTRKADQLEARQGLEFTPIIGMGVVVLCVLLILWAVRSARKAGEGYKRLATVAGGVSYPLYLLHQNIGYVVIEEWVRLGGNRWTGVVVAVAGVLGISYFVWAFAEPLVRRLGGRVSGWTGLAALKGAS